MLGDSHKLSFYVNREWRERNNSPAGRYGAVNPAALIAWLVAVVVGLGLVTSTAALFSWTGYLLGAVGGKQGAVGASSIGLWVAFVLAGAIYAVLAPLAARRSARAAR